MRRDPILGFFGRAGLTPGRGVGRTASGGIGPTRHSLDRGVPRPRPERDLGDDGLALRPRRATTCLGEGWAARAIHSLRVHKREPRSQQHRWTPRGPAPSRRSITGHGAQKAGAHTLCAHPLARRPRVLVARQHAVSEPTSLIRGRGRGAGSRLGRLQAARALVVHARRATERRVGRGGNERAQTAGDREPGADWRGARCMPRGRGRRPRPVAVSLAREDFTTTPRWRARAQNCVLRRGRPVSRIGQKMGNSTTCEPRTLRRSAWSRPPRRQRPACTSPPRRARTARRKWAA